MISRTELERIAKQTSDEGIVSVYLKIDPQLGYSRGQPDAKFKGSASRFARSASKEAVAVLDRERPRIHDFLSTWKPQGRALVLFSSEPAGIWDVLNLEMMVPSFVTVGNTTHTGVLAQVVDEFPRMAVALLDGESARIYLAEQGHEEEMAEVRNQIPGRHDQGGWSQARFQRHIDLHGTRHLKEVVDEIQGVYNAEPFDRLVLVGVNETVMEIRKMLPDPLARRTIGDFSVDFKQESDERILQRAAEISNEYERKVERELVQQIVDGAESGGQGAAGISQTLEALVAERVETLAVAEGVSAGGAVCESCSYLAASRFDKCPVCGNSAEDVPDVIEHAIERAYLGGAHVNIVFGEPREWLLARGGMGATLRY